MASTAGVARAQPTERLRMPVLGWRVDVDYHGWRVVTRDGVDTFTIEVVDGALDVVVARHDKPCSDDVTNIIVFVSTGMMAVDPRPGWFPSSWLPVVGVVRKGRRDAATNTCRELGPSASLHVSIRGPLYDQQLAPLLRALDRAAVDRGAPAQVDYGTTPAEAVTMVQREARALAATPRTSSPAPTPAPAPAPAPAPRAPSPAPVSPTPPPPRVASAPHAPVASYDPIEPVAFAEDLAPRPSRARLFSAPRMGLGVGQIAPQAGMDAKATRLVARAEVPLRTAPRRGLGVGYFARGEIGVVGDDMVGDAQAAGGIAHAGERLRVAGLFAVGIDRRVDGENALEVRSGGYAAGVGIVQLLLGDHVLEARATTSGNFLAIEASVATVLGRRAVQLLVEQRQYDDRGTLTAGALGVSF